MLAAECPAPLKPAPSLHEVPPLQRDDPWAASQIARTVEFAIRADAEADSLCRLLGFFAQLSLVPQRVEVTRGDEGLQLTLRQDGITAHRAEVVAQKMRSLVCVAEVDWRPA
jgi:hypothetical protein